MINLSLGARARVLRQSKPGNAQEVILVTAGDGIVATARGNGRLTLTLTAPAHLAGTYRVMAQELAAGPVCLVPPRIVPPTAPETDPTLRAEGGLWACLADGTTPLNWWR